MGKITISKTKYFLKIFKQAEKKYGSSVKRLAADNWKEDWQTLVATIMSAQTRDETTIPAAENLFAKYSTLEKLSKAKYDDVLNIIRKINFSPRKAKILVRDNNSKVPEDINILVTLPGVGRKTANLVLSEVHNKDSITVDTHVNRLSNVLNIVHTKTPKQTEFELMKIVPREYWSRINRIFVLWGKDVPGYDKEKLLEKLDS